MSTEGRGRTCCGRRDERTRLNDDDDGPGRSLNKVRLYLGHSVRLALLCLAGFRSAELMEIASSRSQPLPLLGRPPDRSRPSCSA